MSRHLLHTAVTTLILICCSCAQTKNKSGDFSSFFIKNSKKYGGHPHRVDSLPDLKADWIFEKDKNGFHILLRGQSFPTIIAFLEQTFGPPSATTEKTAEHGLPARLWAVEDAGVVIKCMARRGSVEVFCMKGLGTY